MAIYGDRPKNSNTDHNCPVKREGESLKALNGGRFRAEMFGVDLNV